MASALTSVTFLSCVVSGKKFFPTMRWCRDDYMIDSSGFDYLANFFARREKIFSIEVGYSNYSTFVKLKKF